MDEKTAALRDIFIDTTGSESVTERQTESPGSLTEEREDVTERLAALLGRMRERYDFETDLAESTLLAILRGFYDDRDDESIAAELGCSTAAVRRARLDLHLVRESDRAAPFDLEELRRLLVEDAPLETRAERLDSDPETVAHYSEVVAADLRSRRANGRFRDAFAELLTDADLTDHLAADAREDGLREATEDLETDVSF